MKDTYWLCDVLGLISPTKIGSPSYAGNYRLVYFEYFRALQVRKGGQWVFINRIVPEHIRSCYAAASYFGV